MKKEKNIKEEKTNYYELKTEAVDNLVDALSDTRKDITNENKQQKNKDQPNPYKIDKLSRIPTWIKAFFIKFWVGGAICYFFFWGLGFYITNTLDLIVLTGLATGVITGLFVNTALLYFESDKKEYHSYMLLPVPIKKFWTIFVNIPFGIVEVLLVFGIYSGINILIINIFNITGNNTPLSVGPILYGVFYLLVDMAIISIKNLIVYLCKKRQNKREK